MSIKKPYIWIFALLISQLLYIGSLKFLCLPLIIRGILCGVGTRILKIWQIEDEIWARQKFKCKVFYQHPLLQLQYQYWYQKVSLYQTINTGYYTNNDIRFLIYTDTNTNTFILSHTDTRNYCRFKYQKILILVDWMLRQRQESLCMIPTGQSSTTPDTERTKKLYTRYRPALHKIKI